MNAHRCLFLLIALGSGVWINHARGQQARGLPANQLVLPATSHTIAFEWQGDSLGTNWEPYAALLLPVRLPGCPQQLYMQFDSGSPYSMFYRETLLGIAKGAIPMTDSAQTLENYTFHIGTMPVTAKSIAVKQFSDPRAQSGSINPMVIIGTIGSDFMENRVIMIDYPQKRITNGAELPTSLKAEPLMSEFSFPGRSVLLPAIIHGAETMLFFDTGSSAFELLTDKENFDRMATPGLSPVQYQVTSWDKILTARTSPTRDSLTMAFTRVPIRHVTYMEGASAAQINQMRKLGIGGMTGNKLFLHHRLLLDVRNKKFAVLEPQ
nr:hypothetical protein [uncultured Dyadobacter sp.]